ncbi:calcium-dependent secretion activator [Trichinella spiralis]|uniref:calcium-dependent secretion activator n=1 Tax=Trichinella spiralis TaxID=6334 RepID=UPI0001EFC900|nr:calcium-dependent secretion activator [Trichinella spiralis]
MQTTRSKPLTAQKEQEKTNDVRFSISLKSLLTLHAYRPSLKQISSVYSRDHHLFRKQRSICLKSTQLKRRQYEVEQKKAGGAGGYFSGSIPLVPAPDIRKG